MTKKYWIYWWKTLIVTKKVIQKNVAPLKSLLLLKTAMQWQIAILIQSYNEVTQNPYYLPRCILLFEVIANKKKNASVAATLSNKTNDNAPQNPKCTNKFRKNPLPAWNNSLSDEYNCIIPDFQINNFTKQGVLDPIQCLNKLWTEEFFLIYVIRVNFTLCRSLYHPNVSLRIICVYFLALSSFWLQRTS